MNYMELGETFKRDLERGKTASVHINEWMIFTTRKITSVNHRSSVAGQMNYDDSGRRTP